LFPAPEVPTFPSPAPSADVANCAKADCEGVKRLAEEWSSWWQEWKRQAAAVRSAQNLGLFIDSIEVELPAKPASSDRAAEFRKLVSEHVDALWDVYRRRPDAYLKNDISGLLNRFQESRKAMPRFRTDQAKVTEICRLIREGDAAAGAPH
jgi:hypothetical protein